MDRIKLSGAPGSPYTRKMLALLRYRHIPYELIIRSFRNDSSDLPKAKVQLAPTFYFPDAHGELEAVVDSTPIIRQLEDMAFGRSVIPSDAALAFIDYLLEDYADEWLTKAMFHYRWYYGDDIHRAGEILPRWGMLTAPEEQIAPMKDYIRDRQIGRLYVVGSNDTTAPVIEDSYKRFLDCFDVHIRNGPFVLGQRPSASDFAFFGQLTQLTAFDPTPMAETLLRSPQVFAWVMYMEDTTGVPDDASWFDRDDLPDTLRPLLAEVGRVHVPALLANARAVDEGAAEVRTEIDGRTWLQEPFPYQAKCLQWLRQEYVRLDGDDRSFVDHLLDGTGCEALFVKPAA
ncbi:MAG: glutathione S-transferase N-terminal domain-containing protein [Pseudomonadales bacterium]|nr:glutathione S-transferase N-terminal domain-containing protein [Pseudomonadales bacterium]MDP6472674.1 glutathione S-transferase N-terminal domain-containing protein [Pseudomonadales bacterium]MDP6827886.1 glutathione S-transferase N-terminal domain-containing protein [Pseudomonadales bacterium]MDP6972694.1 glutathione S-transferase N-terminal domain-containing protein [Pseudomonadales bacterium]